MNQLMQMVKKQFTNIVKVIALGALSGLRYHYI